MCLRHNGLNFFEKFEIHIDVIIFLCQVIKLFLKDFPSIFNGVWRILQALYVIGSLCFLVLISERYAFVFEKNSSCFSLDIFSHDKDLEELYFLAFMNKSINDPFKDKA